MVRDRRMPPAKRINSRAVWDRIQLDRAFEALAEDASDPWSKVAV